MGSFVDAGFLDKVGAYDFDVLAVDAHFGYYMKRSLIPRLHEDVIRPAREAGYEHIWLLGVSMGGLGAILYAAEHPGVVDGMVLLAPYLGDPELAAEIQASGGLSAWNPDESQFKAHEVDVWRWLQASRTASEPVPILMGYGLDDRFAGYYGPLQGEVAGLRIYTEDGGHKWTTWARLWQTIQPDFEHRR
jgi:pimeloyl-ACP methyl ester carboxylesterase